MFSLPDHTTRKIVWFCAVMAPLATVQVARLFGGPGPAGASASLAHVSTLKPELALPADVAPALSPAQQRARDFIQNYQLPADLPSPMDRPDPVPATPAPLVEAAPEPVAPPAAAAADPLAGITISAIIGRDEAVVAMINHKLRRIGDLVVPGWRVDSIDPRTRQVTIVNDQGTKAVLSFPTPGE